MEKSKDNMPTLWIGRKLYTLLGEYEGYSLHGIIERMFCALQKDCMWKGQREWELGPWPKVSLDSENILSWQLKGRWFHRMKSEKNVSDSYCREERKSGSVIDHQSRLKIVACFNDEFSFFDKNIA